MITINLRDFYHWYGTDEFIEVTEEVAAELIQDKNYEDVHNRRMRRNKSISLDVESDLDKVAMSCNYGNPESYVLKLEQQCRLCRALNDLPEIQGRRVEAHYILGKSQSEIARIEGVHKSAICNSISIGLANIKNNLRNLENRLNFCP